MKTIKHLVFLLLSVFLLSACSSDDELTPTDGDRTPVSFTANVGHLQTRTTDGGNQWVAGDEIGIFMKQAGDPLSSASAIESNRKYKTDAEGNFVSDGEGQSLYWPQDGAAVDFVAYYPYQASFSTPYIYEVDVSNQSDPAKIDLLYSNDATNKSKSKDAVDLSFDHILTKVVMTLKKGEGLSDAELATLTVKLTNMPTTADFSLADGAWSNKDNKTEITPLKTENSYEAILIPQAAGANGEMTFKLGNETFSYTIAAELEAGKQYTYNVTVTRTGVEVKTGEITDWKPTNAFYQIGDPYPDAENPIGIIYELSEDKKHGKIVSLDETQLKWSEEQTVTGARDPLNGMANMHTITQISDWENKYPAFAWVHGKNDTTTDYSDPDAKRIWYLPAIDELDVLFLVYNKDREGFNASLTTAGGALLSDVWYWSSSEYNNDDAWVVTFDDGSRDYNYKSNRYRVRCVSAF